MAANRRKPWQKRPTGRRVVGARELRRVLLVCEDSKSSCLYFQSFPYARSYVELVTVGTGMNTDSLVEEAIKRSENSKRQGCPFSEVWCVFDRDDFPAHNFNRAFDLAKRHRLQVAWANEAFELWYLLHFQYFDTGMKRSQYAPRLTKLLGVKYDKADRGIYARLVNFQSQGMKHARRLEKQWNDLGGCKPERDNPSTNIHLLVEFLNELAELGPTE